ncbi:MAG: MFS transporter [Flavisolibacter sp.]
MQTATKKVVNAWAMYDWANSAYNLVITSTIFPAYWEEITGDGNELTTDHVSFLGFTFNNNSLYNYSLSVAFLLVAITSPFLSSIADTRGNKKTFMAFFLTLGSFACTGLFFFTEQNITLGVVLVILACLGFWSSLVFYNSYLPDIAAPEDRDRVSAKGFSYGYIGSVILQAICFVFVFYPNITGSENYLNIRIAFLLTGIWWFGFAQIPLRRLPQPKPSVTEKKQSLTAGYRELQKVWRQLTHMPRLKRFLFSYFFYNMGVQTVMLAATLYGKSELQLPTVNLIIAIVLIQLIAIPGAVLISKLSNRIGNIKALMACVVVWIVACVWGYFIPVRDTMQFYGLAVTVGFVMGGIQSMSRSTYSKLMPETKDTTSFFSFFDVTEKIAIVIGMFSFGFITDITNSQRGSVLALVVFFVIGFFLLVYTLQAKQKKIHEAAYD